MVKTGDLYIQLIVRVRTRSYEEIMITSAYLYRWVSVLDVVLQVTHQHQVTCLVPA